MPYCGISSLQWRHPETFSIPCQWPLRRQMRWTLSMGQRRQSMVAMLTARAGMSESMPCDWSYTALKEECEGLGPFEQDPADR